MPAKTQRFKSKLVAILGSRWFFWAIVSLFVVQAAWVALSSRYPMAFDEGTHLGVIKIFSHHWGPLILQQPDGPAPYGALIHTPLYLYHWLMSWPYRLLSSAFDLQATVIMLRFLNIAFFAGGLILFRKLLLKTKASPALVHAALLFFVLIPIVPLLAGQINYDNLLFLLLAWNLLLVLRFREQLAKKRTFNVGLFAGIFSLAMLASLVKYAYLPILTAITLYVLFIVVRSGASARKLWQSARKLWRISTAVKRYGTLVLFGVSLGLFVHMYGVNVVKYHSVAPPCGQILDARRCMAYGPWARNYVYAQNPLHETNPNPLVYTGGWLSGMVQRTFFVINGPTGPEPYVNKPPLPLMVISAVAVFACGLVLALRYFGRIVRSDPVLSLLLFVSLAYILTVWIKLYVTYINLDRLVAINGRYMLLVILPLMLLAGMAWRQWIARRWQSWLFAIVFILFMQGGGIISFIYFSNKNWYWVDSPTVQRVNRNAKQLIQPFIVNWPPDWR